MLATSVVSLDRELVELDAAGTGTGVKAGLDAGLDLQAPGRGPHARLVVVGADAAGLVVGLHLHDAISLVLEGSHGAAVTRPATPRLAGLQGPGMGGESPT